MAHKELLEQKLLKQLQLYEALPNTAIVSTKVAAAILGTCERVIRYHPRLPRIPISSGRYGFRKGDIDALCNNGMPPEETRTWPNQAV